MQPRSRLIAIVGNLRRCDRIGAIFLIRDKCLHLAEESIRCFSLDTDVQLCIRGKAIAREIRATHDAAEIAAVLEKVELWMKRAFPKRFADAHDRMKRFKERRRCSVEIQPHDQCADFAARLLQSVADDAVPRRPSRHYQDVGGLRTPFAKRFRQIISAPQQSRLHVNISSEKLLQWRLV